MKTELPLAVALIACGSLLWIYCGPTEKPNQSPEKSTISSVIAASFNQEIDLPQLPADLADERIHNSSDENRSSATEAIPNQAPIKTPNTTGANSPASNTATRAATDANADAVQHSPTPLTKNEIAEESRQLIAMAAKGLNESPPLAAKARMRINSFGQSLVTEGRYLQQGQGTRQSRFDFAYSDEDTTFQVMQMCDGRFYYTLTAMNEKSQLEFVDLQQLAEANTKQLCFSAGPSGWVATGGVASLLQHLSVAFDFAAPQQVQLGGVSMIQVRGQWKHAALDAMLLGQINPKALEGDVQWSKIPKQIPHQVSITLGNDTFLPLFPYRIEFSRFEEKEDNEIGAATLSVLELFEVSKLDSIPEAEFQIAADHFDPLNATQQFVQRVKEFDHYQNVFQKKQESLAKAKAQAKNSAALNEPVAQTANSPSIPAHPVSVQK